MTNEMRKDCFDSAYCLLWPDVEVNFTDKIPYLKYNITCVRDPPKLKIDMYMPASYKT